MKKIIAIAIALVLFVFVVSAFAEEQRQSPKQSEGVRCGQESERVGERCFTPQKSEEPPAGKYLYFSRTGELRSCVVGNVPYALPACINVAPPGPDGKIKLYKSSEERIINDSAERRRVIEETTR